MRVMASAEHATAEMDPFGFLPCQHQTVLIHILDGETMGEDLVECQHCGYVVTMADLFRPMAASLAMFMRP